MHNTDSNPSERPAEAVERGDDDQALTPEGCTFEEAAISLAAEPVEAKMVAVAFDRWTFEEGWRCGREYEQSRLTTERHRLAEVEGERDKLLKLMPDASSVLVPVATLNETRAELERLRDALRQMIRVTELPGTRSEIAPEMERAKSVARAALAASQEET